MDLRRKYSFRRIILLFGVWIACSVIMHLYLFEMISFVWIFGPVKRLGNRQLEDVMLPINISAGVANPWMSLVSPNGYFYHLYHLPKRKRNVQYGEITSANRDSRFPLGPDFTFHIEYQKRQVTIYEDNGCGCIYRIFLYPPLPTHSEVLQKMTSGDLATMYLVLEVDNKAPQRHSLKDMMDAVVWPFISPLSTRHRHPSSGIGAYMAVCYETSMRIIFEHNHDFPDNLFELNINCTANELLCPVHIYSAVSRHKFPLGSRMEPVSRRVESLSDIPWEDVKQPGRDVARLMENPEVNGPGAGVDCVLSCFLLCKSCQRVLLHKIHSSGVINAIRLRIFDISGAQVPDWNHVLLTAYFDESAIPLINRVPIGSLFGATGSLNEHRGAAFGKRSMYCSYKDNSLPNQYNAVTGYFYLPMPYWREVLLVVDGTVYMPSTVRFCFQVVEVPNFFVESETGYLNVVKTYYGDDVSGWRDVIHARGGWGQLVGLVMEVDNLVAIRDAPLMYRWAALQSDSLIYVDDSQSATVLGTGLEDYFSYAHGFAGAENTSYAFVGVHHAGPQRAEPLTWHCYRQHVLDPIIFRDSLRLVMEGTDSTMFMGRVPSLTYDHHRARLANGSTSISHVALFYFRSHPFRNVTSSVCDLIELGNVRSESEHSFEFTARSRDRDAGVFTSRGRRFIGDTARNATFTVTGRTFKPAEQFSFVLSVAAANSGVYSLRRTFEWAPRRWNSRCRLSVNGVDRGFWFVPMGSLSDEYSLQTDDVTLLDETGGGRFRISVEPMSDPWKDLSYELCAVS